MFPLTSYICTGKRLTLIIENLCYIRKTCTKNIIISYVRRKIIQFQVVEWTEEMQMLMSNWTIKIFFRFFRNKWQKNSARLLSLCCNKTQKTGTLFFYIIVEITGCELSHTRLTIIETHLFCPGSLDEGRI